MSEQPPPLLRLIMPGAAVMILQASIRAVVLKSQIVSANSNGDLAVEYLVRWFDDGEPHDDWFCWHEVEIDDESFMLVVNQQQQAKDPGWEE